MNWKQVPRSMVRVLMRNRPLRTALSAVARAGLLAEPVWRRLPVECAFRVGLPDGRSFLYSSVANDRIGRALFWGGLESWENETTRVFYDLAREAAVVLDIGANTGVFSLLACTANPLATVIAFEPVPRVHDRLAENIRLNRLQDRCEARGDAVSDTGGVTRLHVPASDLPTSASLNASGFRGLEGILIEVPVTTIDQVARSIGAPVDLVKIDVEGFEDKVLEGMQEVLERSRPALVIECNTDGPVEAIQSLLSKFGYRFFHLRGSGPIEVATIAPDPTGKYRNFLCVVRGGGTS